jgi:aminoglycoside phosphotransferase (APT) family kinase protein
MHRRSTEADSDSRLIEGLTRWLKLHRGFRDPRVLQFSRPKGGYSSDTIFIELATRDNGQAETSSLVLRKAPRDTGTIADYDLLPQFEAQMTAAAAGVPVADPILELDSAWVGEPFIVMPRVNGRVIAQSPYRDPWVASLSEWQRGQLVEELLGTLAGIHRAQPDAAPHVPRRDNSAELEYWGRYLSWSRHGSPVGALVEALTWCKANRPIEESQPALLWGDVRFENCVFGDDLTLQAVLDWDMTSVGAPEHDLAWFTTLGLTLEHLAGERILGFPDRDETVARFEELSGRPMNDLAWYETFAMLRSTAILTRINVLRQDKGKALLFPFEKNPMLDLLTMRLK